MRPSACVGHDCPFLLAVAAGTISVSTDGEDVHIICAWNMELRKVYEK